ncbi:hypothetical protein C7447_10541 [Tenacibaculum adriaticum]|uniref:TIGR01777 family protein n=1 Tax=Tenacibaculum adriaticum TaxID=413713 RepID=A0A5S5DNT7_9FLAO|nr:TIGR01777 family oxidoreductase [Tenacibaculum adriaticum]TYP97028.1 hypothetical protein C7447_10541 [Tenacibaculum adriaticum]
MKILITGGTGLVGKHLTTKLEKEGYEVVILSRNPKKENEYEWNISKNYIDEKALKNTDYIIHLAGAGIADKRWTNERKKILIDSRVQSANLLFSKVKELKIPLKKFISASGIGYYGAVTSNKIFTEEDNSGNDFVSDVCSQWETSANQFQQLQIPVTILRTGIVLSKNGGALPKINTPIFLSILGNGNQFMPWIHIEDLCNLYIEAIKKNTFKGVFNAVAPENHTNLSFTKILGKVIGKPVLAIHVPSLLLKAFFGEMTKILLEGSKISAEKTTKIYTFKYPSLAGAFDFIFKNEKN